MNAENNYLLDLADAVLDGRPVDWSAVADGVSESERDLVAGFQSVANITAFHVEASHCPSYSTGDADAGQTLPMPAQWGPLTLTGLVGRGRFGDVYRAREPRLDRPVALKLLRRIDREADAAATAVIDEGRLMARVRHHNVVTVYGAERIDGRVGLWMELVDGRTLDEVLRHSGPLPWREACRVGIDLCHALAAVHQAGLLHRDLKAQNVLQDANGRIMLTDFGAGKVLSGDGEQQVDVAGTPLYLAPEIFDGAPASIASDIYSLGVLMFHLVTGSYPVTGRTIAELREAHEQGRRSPLRAARAELPTAFANIVDRALAPKPGDRYASAEKFAAALIDIVGTPREGTATVSAQRAPNWWRLGAAATAVSAAIIAMIYSLAVHGVDRAPSLRKVRLPSFDVGVPSHDGSVFPYVDTRGRLHLWEVETDRSRILTEPADANQTAIRAAASFTGDRVAYSWSMGAAGFELRVINADGTWPRVLIPRQTAYEPMPVDWSRDGDTLLCWLQQKNGSADLVAIRASGGPPRLLHTTAASAPRGARFSPDGDFVVTSIVDGPKSRNADIVLIDVASASATVVTSGALADAPPVWLPDGSGVLFVRASRDVPDGRDAWVLPIEDGGRIGVPAVLLPNVGVGTIFVTSEGALYRSLTRYSADVYTRSIDLSGATEPGPPSRISATEVGNHVGPAWSPDGRSIAYFTIRDPDVPGSTPVRTLTIQDVATTRARLLPLPLSFLGGYTPRWSPDGRSVVVFGRDTADQARFGHYQVNVLTGEVTPLIMIGNNNSPPFGEYAPDGRAYRYMDPERGLVARAFDDASESTVIALDDGSGARFAAAPDDHAIALIRQWRQGELWTTALEVRQRDGRRREIARRVTPRWLELHGWTPDGRGLIYAEGNAGEANRFFRVSESGGPATDLRFANTQTPNPIALSPDGRRVAYPERVVERELWITPLSYPLARPTTYSK